MQKETIPFAHEQLWTPSHDVTQGALREEDEEEEEEDETYKSLFKSTGSEWMNFSTETG